MDDDVGLCNTFKLYINNNMCAIIFFNHATS